MSISVILERSVSVRCWHVVGQVAKAEKVSELKPILLRVHETGGTDAHDLAEHLLFESRSRLVVAERLLQIAHNYGLVMKKRDSVYALTEAGETAVETAEVLVPEYGTWSIWSSDDPLLSSHILRIAPWKEPSANEEIRVAKGDDAKQRFPKAMPDWLRDVTGTPIKPAAQEATVVRIDELEGKVEAVDGKLRLRWNVGDRRLHLTGYLEETEISTELEAPPISANQLWLALLEEKALSKWWDFDRQQLRVPFREINDIEREVMSCNFKFESPDVYEYGRFESVSVQEVPITPATEADAQSWAKWRLQKRIEDFATSERYAKWCAEAVEPFDQYEVELPTRTVLFEYIRNQKTNRLKPNAWHVVAAEDWDL